MKQTRYIITSHFTEREQDGIDSQDGSQIWIAIKRTKTWCVEPNETIGEIMKKVEEDYPHHVTITKDSSEQKPW